MRVCKEYKNDSSAASALHKTFMEDSVKKDTTPAVFQHEWDGANFSDKDNLDEKPTFEASSTSPGQTLNIADPVEDDARQEKDENGEQAEHDEPSSSPTPSSNDEMQYPSMTTKILVGIGLALAVFLV
jgi:hypothetical protein